MKIAGRMSQVAGAVALMLVTVAMFGSIDGGRTPYNSKTVDGYIVKERASDAMNITGPGTEVQARCSRIRLQGIWGDEARAGRSATTREGDRKEGGWRRC